MFVKWLLLFCLGEKCCSRAGLFQHNIHPWCRIDEDFEDHIFNLILFPEYEYNRFLSFCLFLWRYRHCFRTVHHCINASDTYSDNICITTVVAMYELYSFVEHTLYSRPVIRAVLFDTQFCLILKTEYNPHYNSTKMNTFSSSYNLLSTYECLSSKSQMYFPFITLYWFCSCMILACTIQKLFKICFILINLWFLTWTTLQLTSQVSGDQWNIIQGFPVTLSTDNLQNARSLITAADMDARKWRHTELFWISDKCKENKLKNKNKKG